MMPPRKKGYSAICFVFWGSVSSFWWSFLQQRQYRIRGSCRSTGFHPRYGFFELASPVGSSRSTYCASGSGCYWMTGSWLCYRESPNPLLAEARGCHLHWLLKVSHFSLGIRSGVGFVGSVWSFIPHRFLVEAKNWPRELKTDQQAESCMKRIFWHVLHLYLSLSHPVWSSCSPIPSGHH